MDTNGGMTIRYRQAAYYTVLAQRALWRTPPAGQPLQTSDIKQTLSDELRVALAADFALSFSLAQIAEYDQSDGTAPLIITDRERWAAARAHALVYDMLQPDCDIARSQAGIDALCALAHPPQTSLSDTIHLCDAHLGGALAQASGRALGQPEQTVYCLIDSAVAQGDTPWHLAKLLSPATDGTIIPIIQLRPKTLLATLSTYELLALFIGYGYEPRIVDCTTADPRQPDANYTAALAWATERTAALRQPAQLRPHKARRPLLLVRTPEQLETLLAEHETQENSLAPAENDTSDAQPSSIARAQAALAHRKADGVNSSQARTQAWLTQVLAWCEPENLFDAAGNLTFAETKALPHTAAAHADNDSSSRTAQLTATQPALSATRLRRPAIEPYAVVATPPGTQRSNTLSGVSSYLADLAKDAAPDSFRLFISPSLQSGTLAQRFASNPRAWQWGSQPSIAPHTPDGHTMSYPVAGALRGMQLGYLEQGRQSVFVGASLHEDMSVASRSYTAALSSQPRGASLPSLNTILSHQSAEQVTNVLDQRDAPTTVYFPADSNCAVVTLDMMLSSTQVINVLHASDTTQPTWLTTKAARAQMHAGLATWNFASHTSPDIVLAACGDVATTEVLAAIELITHSCPAARVRCVNISSLAPRGFGTLAQPVSRRTLARTVTTTKPVIIAYPGEERSLAATLFAYGVDGRQFAIHSFGLAPYGDTLMTSLIRQQASRYDLAIAAATCLSATGVISPDDAQRLAGHCHAAIEQCLAHAREHHTDHPMVTTWQWQQGQ
jgi:probable phosphoketolase 1